MIRESENSPSLQLNLSVPGTAGSIDKIINSIVNLVSLTGASHDFLNIDLPLVLDELLRNAVKHGNKNDSQKKVTVNLSLQDKQLFLEIEDEGCGFELTKLDSGAANSNHYSGSGRGLLMVGGYCKKIDFTNQGSKVQVLFDICGVVESKID